MATTGTTLFNLNFAELAEEAFAYVHCTPDGAPFYVGAGSRKRMRDTFRNNADYMRIRDEHGPKAILRAGMECSSKDIALELEQGLIKCLTRSGVELTNYCSGGKGTPNPTEASRARMSAAAKKRGVSDACHTARVIAKTGKPISEEQKELLRQRQTGRVFSEEHRRNISIAARNRRKK